MGDILKFPIRAEVRARADAFGAILLKNEAAEPFSFSANFHALGGDKIDFTINYPSGKVPRRLVVAMLIRVAALMAQPPKSPRSLL
jgi:hypothetical protein